MAYQLRLASYRKVCFYSTDWSKGKEGQNRLLWAKLNLCRAAGSHEIKPLTVSAVFIIRWPFLCVLCCDFDVLSHNRGATILWRLPIKSQTEGIMFHVSPLLFPASPVHFFFHLERPLPWFCCFLPSFALLPFLFIFKRQSFQCDAL